MEEELGYITLSDEAYNKGVFLVRGAIMKIMKPLELYGQRDYVEQAITELTKVCEDFGLYVRGDLSHPVSIEYIRREK